MFYRGFAIVVAVGLFFSGLSATSHAQSQEKKAPVAKNSSSALLKERMRKHLGNHGTSAMAREHILKH